MDLEISKHLQNHHLNLGHQFSHHLQKVSPALLFMIIIFVQKENLM